MFKQVMLSEENVELLKKYGDSPNKAISNLMVSTSVPQTVHLPTPDLEKKIEALMSRMDTFMSHGQGGIRVYPMPVDKVDGKCVPRVVERCGEGQKHREEQLIDPQEAADNIAKSLGFRRASLSEEK